MDSLQQLSLIDFAKELASDSPAPGGGSVAALASSLGAGLAAMGCRLTLGRKKYADVQEDVRAFAERADTLRNELMALVDRDTEAYNEVVAAWKLPKGNDEEKAARAQAIHEATRHAAEIPLETLRLSLNGLKLLKKLAFKGNTNAISDIGVATLMLRSGMEGAAYNVEINLKDLDDAPLVESMRRELADARREADAIAATVAGRVAEILA